MRFRFEKDIKEKEFDENDTHKERHWKLHVALDELLV